MFLGITLSLSSAHGQSLQVSGGLDARVTNERESQAETGPFQPQLTGAFLNLRKVWGDEFGDRWIGVAQADFDDNFQRIRPYQLYLQYKGPLGKWNVRAGHYLLPFGLLATYDTERLVLQGLEKTSLGIRKDTGVEAFGRYGSWDYAVSLSHGLSDVRFVESRANPVITGRIAYVQGDAQLGFSTLVGRVLLDPEFDLGRTDVRERRFAVDGTKSFGPLTVRAEGIAGTNDGHTVGGGVFLGDYALTPKLELNTRYAYWAGENAGHGPGLGLTYQLRQGLFLRTAGTYQSTRDNHYGFTVQLYYEFSKLL
jgi:hypothetical protein